MLVPLSIIQCLSCLTTQKGGEDFVPFHRLSHLKDLKLEDMKMFFKCVSERSDGCVSNAILHEVEVLHLSVLLCIRLSALNGSSAYYKLRLLRTEDISKLHGLKITMPS